MPSFTKNQTNWATRHCRSPSGIVSDSVQGGFHIMTAWPMSHPISCSRAYIRAGSYGFSPRRLSHPAHQYSTKSSGGQNRGSDTARRSWPARRSTAAVRTAMARADRRFMSNHRTRFQDLLPFRVKRPVDGAPFLAELPLEIGQVIHVVPRVGRLRRRERSEPGDPGEEPGHHFKVVADVAHEVRSEEH